MSKKSKKSTKTARKPSKGIDILIDEMEGSLWVAAVNGGKLEGLEVDPQTEEVRWGSIYWAKVARIDAAQDAAFVNLDGENIGILYNADVVVKKKDGTYKRGGDVAIGKVLQPGEMIAVQAKSGYLPKDPAQERTGDKNPKVSMNVVLQGRYLIYTPMERDNRVSRRIIDKNLRKQLKAMMDDMQEKGVEGCILRASGANIQSDILRREANILRLTWEQLCAHLKGEDPALIMLGPDAVQRTLGDNAGRPVDHIELTTMDHFQHAEEWCEIFAPDLVTRIMPLELPEMELELGLFEYRDIIGQIDDLLQPYIILENGGVVIIQETAALTAIDVNSGGDNRGHFAINMEAAAAIARHLRLRNMGGAIVIDFLRMKNKGDQERLRAALERFFNDDPCTVQIHGVTHLGFTEVTRQRRTPPLMERFESSAGQQ